ncbi:MAG: Protein FecR [Pseudomonas citronellolis]|nr:MAG: Protein FecR [Pseudomonas citronellolis]
MNLESLTSPPETPERAARRWLLRRREGVADEQAFEAWLATAPAHRQAYAEAEALWQSSAAPAMRLAQEDSAALGAYLAAMQAPAPTRSRRTPRRAAWSLASAAALLLMTLWGGGWMHPEHWWQDLSADYVTAEGEVREWTLPDGSQLTLDAGSAVAVQVDGQQRRVELLRGAALFEVRHLAQPFSVHVGEGSARVLGTAFEVRHQAQGARVVVSEGRVAVQASQQAGAPEVVLAAGEQASFAGAQLSPAAPVDASAALAWRQGWLSVYRRPLAEVLDDLGRYYPGRIVLLNPQLGRQRVSGSFRTDDPQAALNALQALVGFEQHTLFGRLRVIR